MLRLLLPPLPVLLESPLLGGSSVGEYWAEPGPGVGNADDASISATRTRIMLGDEFILDLFGFK